MRARARVRTRTRRLASANNYTADGPCGGQRLQQLAVMPMSTGCKLAECAVKMIISRPAPAKAGVGGCPEVRRARARHELSAARPQGERRGKG